MRRTALLGLLATTVLAQWESDTTVTTTITRTQTVCPCSADWAATTTTTTAATTTGSVVWEDWSSDSAAATTTTKSVPAGPGKQSTTTTTTTTTTAKVSSTTKSASSFTLPPASTTSAVVAPTSTSIVAPLPPASTTTPAPPPPAPVTSSTTVPPPPVVPSTTNSGVTAIGTAVCPGSAAITGDYTLSVVAAGSALNGQYVSVSGSPAQGHFNPSSRTIFQFIPFVCNVATEGGVSDRQVMNAPSATGAPGEVIQPQFDQINVVFGSGHKAQECDYVNGNLACGFGGGVFAKWFACSDSILSLGANVPAGCTELQLKVNL